MTAIDPGAPSPAAQEDERCLARIDQFKAAYRLVHSLEWPDGFSVYDVITTAKFLDGKDA
ncbi:hypothetical protein ACFWFX_18670 [Streptomyces roseolus]|uniref:hypothetical protein n=1 Tax=Streptomyces roseolus TaxID=67358 RepID=UPI0036525058